MDKYLVECMEKAAALNLDFTKAATVSEINDLVKKYCIAVEEKDEYLKNICYAALTVRFWKQMCNVYELARHLPNPMMFAKEDMPAFFYEWLTEACYWIKKEWEKGNEPNCQAFINKIIRSRYGNVRQRECFTNLNRANSGAKSMDTTISTDKDGNEKTLGDTICDNQSCPTALGNCISLEMLIQDYFDRHKFDVAIIIDAIGHNDARDFSLQAVRKFINHLDDSSIDFYSVRYNQNRDYIEKTIHLMQKSSAGQLNTYIKNAISTLRAAIM